MGSGVFWAVTLGFLTGVFVRSLVPIGFSYEVFAILLGVAALSCGVLDRRRLQRSLFLALALASFAGGSARMNAAVLTGDPNLTARVGERVALIGDISAEPDARDTEVLARIDVKSLVVGSTTVPISAGVLAQLPSHAEVRYGDIVRATGDLGLPKPFDAGAGRQFDYPDYLVGNGIAYTLSFAQASSTGKNAGNPFEAAVFSIKQRYVAGIDAVLPEPEAGLAAGITVGDKRSIGPQLSAEFQKVSLIQLVVLSGYNITVVADFAAKFLQWAPRYVRFGMGAFVAAFFVLISGGSSSALRAAVMATLAMYARISGRTFDALRALSFAACAMVLWNPFVLAFDPGFQLSATAMIGLTCLTPLIEPYARWIPERFGLREIAVSTVATQAAVLPLLLYQSGEMSILALPANILAMIPVPLAMLASFIAALGGAIFGAAAVPVAAPAYGLLWYIIAVGHAFASAPFASIAIGSFGVVPLTLSYMALLSICAYGGSKAHNEKSRV